MRYQKSNHGKCVYIHEGTISCPIAVIADIPIRCYLILKTLTTNSSVHLVIARAINAQFIVMMHRKLIMGNNINLAKKWHEGVTVNGISGM